jgi:hypothetical protein
MAARIALTPREAVSRPVEAFFRVARYPTPGPLAAIVRNPLSVMATITPTGIGCSSVRQVETTLAVDHRPARSSLRGESPGDRVRPPGGSHFFVPVSLWKPAPIHPWKFTRKPTRSETHNRSFMLTRSPELSLCVSLR